MPSARSLLVLHDADDLNCVEASCPQALSGDVLAFDTDIHLLLQERGIDHRSPWDIIRYEEQEALQCFEGAVWQHWLNHARLDFEGFNLLNLAGFRHVCALARLSWAAYALRRFVETLQPAVVYTFDEPPAHGLDQPVNYRKMPLLFGLLRGLAQRAGVPVSLISRAALGGVLSFEDQIAKQDVATYEPIDAEAALGDRPFVLFQGNRADLLRQLPLIQKIRQDTDWHVVQLYKDADAAVLREAKQGGHFVWHESQVTGKTTTDICLAADAAYQKFQSAGRAATDELQGLFDNPYVASHFEFLFGTYADKMAMHVVKWKAFFGRCRPVAFVANSHAPIVDVAAAAGIPSLFLGHGLLMLGQPRWYTTLPERTQIGSLSEHHRERLTHIGIAAERAHLTGDPQVEEFHRALIDGETTKTDTQSVRKRLDIMPGQRVVLLCTTCFGMPSTTTHLPTTDWAEGVRSMRALATMAEQHSDWTFVIKCHPRFDHPALYAGVNRTLPPDRRFIIPTEESLENLLRLADVVCVWNTASSVLVEASLADKPVMVYSRALVWYDAAEWGCADWPHFDKLDDLERELETLLGDPKHYSERVGQVRRAVSLFLGDTAQTATARCIQVLEQLSGSPAPA